METSEFTVPVPQEYCISYKQVMRVINLIQSNLSNLELPKTDKYYLDVIKIRVSDEDFGDTYTQDLLVCHFVMDFLMRSHEFRDKYYIWVETSDSEKYPNHKKIFKTSTPIGEADTLGRIRFGQVLSICVRLKSTMLERIKYNMEIGKIQYKNVE